MARPTNEQINASHKRRYTMIQAQVFPELRQKVEESAKNNGYSIRSFIIEALEEKIEKLSKTP